MLQSRRPISEADSAAVVPRADGLASYAADARDPGPREVAESAPATRTPFQRDRDRLLHSIAFRRLARKTQVLMPEEGEQHRTRLTHTLEVAQVARSLARALRLDEDLAEALSLAHDFGHGPFGHTGEEALDRVFAPWGGFDHNVQSLRIVVDLERRYLDFDGLNLTWTTLEGLAKRKGPCLRPTALLRAYDARLHLSLPEHPGAEAQVAALADDIAYNAHDLEDGLCAGLFALEEAAEVPMVGALLRRLGDAHGAVDPARLPFALARGIIDAFVTDALGETGRRLAATAPADIDAVRRLGRPVVALSEAAAADEAALKAFLFTRMYRHPRVVAVRARAHDLVGLIAERYLERPEGLPAPWAAQALAAEAEPGRARIVADYVAGLTDRQAVQDHRRLFDAAGDFL